jgi:phage shock protein C
VGGIASSLDIGVTAVEVDAEPFRRQAMVEMRKPLRRSRTNRMIAGVVGGLAEYWSVDATLARVVFVVVSIISVAFPGLLVYGILWLIIPEGE